MVVIINVPTALSGRLVVYQEVYRLMTLKTTSIAWFGKAFKRLFVLTGINIGQYEDNGKDLAD